MSQAVLFSIPEYILDPLSPATVTGYEVQSSSAQGINGLWEDWTDLPGSPFSSNLNILDTSESASYSNRYRARPVLQVTQDSTVYTLPVPFCRAFGPMEKLYDFALTMQLLPIMRSVYIGDPGTPQSNGTNVLENTGPGQGLWVPDGETSRFSLQYVENDDPIRVLDNWFALEWTAADGTPKSSIPDQDYQVDCANGVVEFATPPAVGDYLRFDFRRCDYSNEFMLQSLETGVAALSQYGINGYQLHQSNNLRFMQKALPNPDLADLVCKISVRNLHEGMVQQALRSNSSWRDGGSQYDPEPSRALEFQVQKWQVSDSMLRKLANGWIRTNTVPLYRGDFDVMFDMSQMSPVSISMFEQFSSFTGYAGVGLSPGYALAFWV